jgi:teichuronic acid biosynthesis glycosyltransferase TuaG
MIDPQVSVIMPAYNAQRYIGESIESVIGQTWQNWELIIVDDGSHDRTANIVQQYQSNDNRIKYFYQENSGQGKAKNTGIRHSKGDYIAFLDSDDLWLKEKLEISVDAIKSGNFALIFTDCYILKNGEKNISGLGTMGVSSDIYEGRSGILTFLYSNRIPNLTVLIKRKAMIEAGEFIDWKVAEDYEMWLRMLKNGCVFKAIPNVLSIYRMHDESITAKDRHATFEVIKIIKLFGQNNPEYLNDAQRFSRDKIKYWLYNGGCRTNKKFRLLMSNLYSPLLFVLFYVLSFIFPIDHLRKIVIRIG